MSAGRRRAEVRPDDTSSSTAVTPGTPTPAAVTSGRRGQRRAARDAAREADQARTMRRLRSWALPVAAAAVALVLLVAFLVVRDDGGSADDAAAGGRTQQTLMLQVVPAVGEPASGNALTARSTNSDSAVFAAVPGRLITDVAGRGRTTLAATTTGADATAGAQALADQIDVLVDGSWTLTEPALAALVDAAGGITVDVDAEVTSSTGGSSVVVLSPGAGQKLDGASAVAYATFRGADEAEQAQLARFTAVWTALLQALPDDEDAVQTLVSGQAGSVSTLPPDQLADYLVDLRRAVTSDSMAYPTLPTVTVDTGSEQPSYRLDNDKVGAFVDQSFAGSRPATPPGGEVTVLVQNGVGTPGLAAAARDKLRAAGLRYEGGGNAERFGYRTSVVLVNDATPEVRAQGAAVAAALGLPASAVRQASQPQSVADVLVILGADFRA